MSENWQLYAQQGVNGTEYGIRIRPGYIVVGFQKEDAEEIIRLHDEVERLRSLTLDQQYMMDDLDKEITAKDARIKELEEANRNIDKRRDEMAAFIERLEAAFREAKRCPTCNGAGKLIDVVISRNLGRVESERVCPLCEGKWEEKAREALEEIKTGGAMSNSVDICPFDDDLTCPLDYHTCEIYRERMEEEQ